MWEALIPRTDREGARTGGVVKSLKRFARNKKAISGLSTAIVLIAFVIVASAFAYAVLNVGFLVIQKSQQVVLGGLAAASSAVVVDGPVYGYSTFPGPNGNITTLIFWLKTGSGASSVDLNPGKTTISYQNPRGLWPNIYYCSNGSGGQGTCVGATSNTAVLTFQPGSSTTVYSVEASATNIVWEIGTGMLLQPLQKVRVTIDLTQIGTGATPTTDTSNNGGTAGLVNKDETFSIIVKPPIGSFLDLQFVTPGQISQVDDLTSIGAGNIGGATNPSPPTGGGTTTIAATSTTMSATTTAATNQGEINPNPPVAGQPFTITASNPNDQVLVGGNCDYEGVTGAFTGGTGSVTLTLSAGQYAFEIFNEVSCTLFTVVPAS